MFDNAYNFSANGLIFSDVPNSVTTMSNYQTLNKIAYCNANKSTDLISCSEAVYQVLNDATVGHAAALERLFYLLVSCEGLEHKVRRSMIPARDPVKLDLEHNIRKSLDVICRKMKSGKYREDMVLVILQWCFKVLSQVSEMLKLLPVLHKILLSAAECLYKFKVSEDTFVDRVFELFSKECPTPTENAANVLVKVLIPYPKIVSQIVRKSFESFTKKTPNFETLKTVISELSKYNCNLVSSAVMDLLEEDTAVNEKVGFVLNVLCSIPSLQPVSIMLLNDSQAFKKLMNSSKEALSTTMIDDLAKLFMHSQVNSYSTVMSLLEQDADSTSLGPSLLQKILLNLELAVYGVTETKDKSAIIFIDNMSSTEDIKMFCTCLTYQKPYKHPYILKCLHIICIYKGFSVAKTVITELILTQPLERFEALLEEIKGLYPNISFTCFKTALNDLKSLAKSPSEVFLFFENADKLKLHNHHELMSKDMVKIATFLNETDNYKLVSFLLRFLDPRAIDIADTIYITNTILDLFIRFVNKITSPDVDIELLESISELKSNVIKWCPIKDCIRLTILHSLLSSLTTDDISGTVEFDDEEDPDKKSVICSLKSAIIESDVSVHRGKIRRVVKVMNKSSSNILVIQSVMNLLQSIISNSPKAGKELSKFLLDLLCPDVNLEAPWPDNAAIKAAIERDLNVLNTFDRKPILWNIFEEALSTRNSDLVVIVRAMLVVLISFWSSSRVKKCADSPLHLANTVKLLDLLSKIEWLPTPMLNISQLIPLISPFEAMNLLFEVTNHFKIHAPHLSAVPVTNFQTSLKDAVSLIVQNNIENIGVTAFLFSRWGISSAPGGA